MDHHETIKILLVENSPVGVTNFINATKEAQLDVDVVAVDDGISALETLRGENGRAPITGPYVIVLDISMPRMNGVEFLQTIRCDPSLEDATVFALTESDADAHISAAFQSNVAGYLLKSGQDDDLLQSVQMLKTYLDTMSLTASPQPRMPIAAAG